MIAAFLLASVLGPFDARQIYLRCSDALNAIRVPAYISFIYQDESTGLLGTMHTSGSERLRIVVRTKDGHAFVQTLRLQNGYQGRIAPVVVGDNAIFPYTGVYRLSDFPTAAFGLRQTVSRPDFLDAAPMIAPSKDSLRVLATVKAVDIPYDLTRLADDVVDGQLMYHLQLKPVRDPKHNVLRGLWIDKTTFEPRRYEAIRYVGQPALFSYLVTINNSIIAGQLINTDLSGQFSEQVKQSFAEDGRPTFAWSPREFHSNVAFMISDVSFPDTLPDWLFNPDTYAAHQRQALPLALSAVGIPPTLSIIRHIVYNYSVNPQASQQGPGRSTSCYTPDKVKEANVDQPDFPDYGRKASAGTIMIDVVAAIQDGGLVVDLSPTVENSIPFARVAISANGDFSYDSRIHFSPAEFAVLKLLARNVIGAKPRSPGETWTLVQNDNDLRSVAHFHAVDSTTDGTQIILMDYIVPPHEKLSASELHGTIYYDADLLLPKCASLSIQSGEAATPERTKAEMTVNLTLKADSFVSHKESVEDNR